MKIEYSKKAMKFIQSLDRPAKQRIKAGIEGLVKSPPEGDIKPMQGFNDERKRLRIGKYRVVYKYVKNELETLHIMDVGSRGDIYK